MILIKKICTDHCDTYWLHFVLSLGLSNLICQPTRVISNSCTLIDQIYTNREDKISCVNVCKLTISDHYAIFGYHRLIFRSVNIYIKQKHIGILNTMMQTHFEMNWLTFLGKPLNILCDIVQVWNSLFS